MELNILIPLRAELICFVILMFFYIYTSLNKSVNAKPFYRIVRAGLIHVIFDALSVYTVNNREDMSQFNHVVHLIFYFTALYFAYEFLSYVCTLVYSPSKVLKARKISALALLAYLIFMPFVRPVYRQGDGIAHSTGRDVMITYGLGGAFFLIAFILISINMRRLEKSVAITLIGMIIFSSFIVVIQVIVPELLLTGGGLTMLTVAVYFTLENSESNYKNRTMIDLSTGVKNLKCYEEDRKILNEKYFSEEGDLTVVGCAICNIVNLKVINEKYGLMEGDKLIRETATLVSKKLASAYNVYRIAGDIFVAIYIGVDRTDGLREVAELRKTINAINKEKEYDYYVAVGFEAEDSIMENNINDIIIKADKLMEHQKHMIRKRIEKENSIENSQEEIDEEE